MMNNTYIFKLVIVLISSFAQAQNVGINTDNPTRVLDVNGNLRVTELQNKTNVAGYEHLLTANKLNGNVDYIDISSLLQSEKNNMEVSRVLYNATAVDNAKECSCGDITFRFNGTYAEFKLHNDNVFTSNNVSTFNLAYGIKRFTGTGYTYNNKTGVAFSKNDASKTSYFSKYRRLDDVEFSTNNSIRTYTIILPKQGNLYRLTLSRLQNTSTTTNFALMCEKFYVQEI